MREEQFINKLEQDIVLTTVYLAAEKQSRRVTDRGLQRRACSTFISRTFLLG
jgi:hypothetical protein